jgi:hypothetical protein
MFLTEVDILVTYTHIYGLSSLPIPDRLYPMDTGALFQAISGQGMKLTFFLVVLRLKRHAFLFSFCRTSSKNDASLSICKVSFVVI